MYKVYLWYPKFYNMAITTIKLDRDTKELLDKIKKKYEISTYNLLLSYLSHYFLKNNINPKIDMTGDYQNSLIQMEIKLTSYLAEIQKKLTNDNITLRKWLGAVTRDHIVPMQKQIFELTEDLRSTAQETPKSNPTSTPQPEDRELFERYEEQKRALFKIFENSKIEQVGMTGAKTRIVVELSEQEWKDLKEVI